jgi:hypothetical protein
MDVIVRGFMLLLSLAVMILGLLLYWYITIVTTLTITLIYNTQERYPTV